MPRVAVPESVPAGTVRFLLADGSRALDRMLTVGMSLEGQRPQPAYRFADDGSWIRHERYPMWVDRVEPADRDRYDVFRH